MGAFYMVKAVLDHMSDEGWTYSQQQLGHRPDGDIPLADHAASKAPLHELTKSLALETTREGITVNCEASGFIPIETMANIPKSILGDIIEKTPVRRLGRPEEAARILRFPSKSDPSYFTGAIYTVNGGSLT